MHELNLGFDNTVLYKGCKVTEFEPGRFRLDTPLDSAVVIAAANMVEILGTIPDSKRGRLVLTGAVPPVFFMTATSILGPHFKQVEHFDGKKKIRIQIPRPPSYHDAEPE